MVSRYTAFTYAAQIPTAGRRDALLLSSLRLERAARLHHELPHHQNHRFPRFHVSTVDLDGVGRVFVGRSLLDAESLADATARLTRYSLAAGHNHQLLDLRTGRLMDLEVAPFWQVGRMSRTSSSLVWSVREHAGKAALARELV